MADRVLYRNLNNTFRVDGLLSTLTAQGNFSRLLEHAKTVDEDVGESYELTVPTTFAIHALASAMATNAQTSEVSRSGDRTTYFLTQFATRLALALPEPALTEAPDPYVFARAISGRVGRIARVVGETPRWLEAKMHTLADRLLLRRHVLRMIDEERPMEVDDFAELKRSNNELFQELRRLKRYRIKPAGHAGLNSNWSVNDLVGVRTNIARAAEVTDTEVRPDQWRPAMVMWAVEHEFEGLVQPEVVVGSDVRPNYEAFGRYVFMDERGQLSGDMYGAMPLYLPYKRADKAVNYETLRQFLIQKYFDLTMPPGIVVRAMEHTNQLLGERNPDEARENGTVFHDLLLTRIRIIRTIKRPEDLDTMESGGLL